MEGVVRETLASQRQSKHGLQQYTSQSTFEISEDESDEFEPSLLSMSNGSRSREDVAVMASVPKQSDTKQSEESGYTLCETLRDKPWQIKDLMKRLDDYIRFHGEHKVSRGEREIILDFGLLETPANFKSDQEHPQPQRREFQLLSSLLDTHPDNSKELLKHPLVMSFILLNWTRFRPLIWFSIIFYAILACSISTYVISVYITLCPYTANGNVSDPSNSTENETTSFIDNFRLKIDALNIVPLGSEESKCVFEGGHWINYGIFLALTFLTLLKEISKIRMLGCNYIRWRNLVGLLLIGCSGVLLLYPACFVTTSLYSYIHYQAAACAVFAVWVYLLFQIGKLPTLGVYIEMFATVLKRLFDFLLTFGVLLVGFILCACVLFPNVESYYTIPRSILKILAMTTGEYSYEDVLYRADGSEPLQYPLLSHVFYTVFILVASLALMNLLVGLAVNDIGEAMAQEELTSLHNTVQQIERLEHSLSLFGILTYFQELLPWKSRSEMSLDNRRGKTKQNSEPPGRRVFVYLAQNPKDTSLPQELKYKALELATANLNTKASPYIDKVYSQNDNVKVDEYDLDDFGFDVDACIYSELPNDLI